MDALSSFLGRKLLERIEARRAEYLRPLLNGQATDYPDYKGRVGYLKALADVEEMIEAIRLDEDGRLHGAARPNEDRPRPRPQGVPP